MSNNPIRQYTKEQLQTEIDLRKSLKKVIANPSIFCDDHISLYYTPECGSANITDHIATMIKIRIAEGVKTKPIYVEYNTTRDIVNNIRCGRSWKHIII